jgi:methylmalonyl-CoA mutase N-terminal domain/subunit
MTDSERRTRTDSGLPLEVSYGPRDVSEDLESQLGQPGAFPFTRGIHPTMYRERLWTMRQYAGFGTAAETNARYRYLLAEGQTGLSVAFDLPTQMGLDSDDPRADGEVGRAGVAIDSLPDMRVLFDGIRLDGVSTSMTINATAPILLALYVAVAEEQGVAPEVLSGTVQNDILKEYVARGTYIFPVEPSLRLVSDLIRYCAARVPRWNPISVSGYHMREAGATAPQEVAFTFANALEYVDRALSSGVGLEDFAPRLSFFFAAHNDFFEEVAKYRALRRLWARMLRDDYGATDARSMMFRTHTQTGGSTLVAQQPENNIVRASIQTLAAVLGGVQSIALSCFDEALAIPTDDAQRMALRTQQIIAHETGVANTIDPLAGSYYVEHLTNELERQAREYMAAILAQGGAIRAIESGWIQTQIAEASWRYQQEVDEGSRTVVGVNDYTEGGDQPQTIFSMDRALVEQQLGNLRRYRAERDEAAVDASLAALRGACAGDANLMEPILEAVRAYATMGEICNAMRDVFGEYRPPTII